MVVVVVGERNWIAFGGNATKLVDTTNQQRQQRCLIASAQWAERAELEPARGRFIKLATAAAAAFALGWNLMIQIGSEVGLVGKQER